MLAYYKQIEDIDVNVFDTDKFFMEYIKGKIKLVVIDYEELEKIKEEVKIEAGEIYTHNSWKEVGDITTFGEDISLWTFSDAFRGDFVTYILSDCFPSIINIKDLKSSFIEDLKKKKE